MRIDIDAIARQRQYCLIALRSLAFLLIVIGAVAAAMTFQARADRYAGFGFLNVSIPVLLVPVAGVLVSFWLPAGVISLGSRRLSRWLVPVPGAGTECPQCGYSLKNLNSPICPECGLSLRDAAPPQK